MQSIAVDGKNTGFFYRKKLNTHLYSAGRLEWWYGNSLPMRAHRQINAVKLSVMINKAN